MNGLDPQLLPVVRRGLALGRLLDEAGGPIGVVNIGHRQTPVRHRAIGVLDDRLAEGSLGLEVPEPM